MEHSLSWEQSEMMRLLQSQPGTQYQEGTAEDRLQIREWLRQMARKSIITVIFAKSDGTVRTMKCTLDPDHIPAAQAPAADALAMFVNLGTGVALKAKKSKKVVESTEPKEDATMRVFDVEAQAWRSFRFDRLHKISAELNFK